MVRLGGGELSIGASRRGFNDFGSVWLWMRVWDKARIFVALFVF